MPAGIDVLCRCAGSILIILAMPACDYAALSFDGGTGLVIIAINGDGPAPSGGYRIRTRQAGALDRIVLVPQGEDLLLEVTSGAPLELTLMPPSGCRVLSPNPRVVTPASGPAAQASFALECTRS